MPVALRGKLSPDRSRLYQTARIAQLRTDPYLFTNVQVFRDLFAGSHGSRECSGRSADLGANQHIHQMFQRLGRLIA
jgi:hypothetical protein